MPDTGKRIGPSLLTNVAATVYTVPALTTYFMKTVRAVNTTATAATIFASIGVDAAGTRIFAGETVPANGSITLDCWIPMAAAEVLQAYSGTNNAIALTVGGVEVT